jgi:hypothetical protein
VSLTWPGKNPPANELARLASQIRVAPAKIGKKEQR